MDVVRIRSATGSAAGAGRHRASRRAAVAILFAVAALLAVTAAAQAAVPGKLLFAKRIGTATSQAGGWSMAAAPNGGVVLAGWQDVASTETAMVARYTSTGARSWLRTYPDMGASHVDAVAGDKAGNVCLAATLLDGYDRVAVIKYGPRGAWQWTRTYDGGADGDDHA